MRLTDRDKKAINAFIDHRQVKGTSIDSELVGKVLRLNGPFLRGVASWKGDHIVFQDMGSKSGQAIHTYIRRHAPASYLEGYKRKNPTLHGSLDYRTGRRGVDVYLDGRLIGHGFTSYDAANDAAFDYLRGLHWSKDEAGKVVAQATRDHARKAGRRGARDNPKRNPYLDELKGKRFMHTGRTKVQPVIFEEVVDHSGPPPSIVRVRPEAGGASFNTTIDRLREPREWERNPRRRNGAGAYSARHPKIAIYRRRRGGGKVGERLPSVGGLITDWNAGKRDWHYYSTTQWFPTVKAAVASMREKHPEYDWRGQKQGR